MLSTGYPHRTASYDSEAARLDDSLQEFQGSRLRRFAEDPFRRPLLDDEAVIQEHDAIGDLAREAHLVGGDDHRHPFGGEVTHDIQHLTDEAGRARS